MFCRKSFLVYGKQKFSQGQRKKEEKGPHTSYPAKIIQKDEENPEAIALQLPLTEDAPGLRELEDKWST
jgi:hypothetical protein